MARLCLHFVPAEIKSHFTTIAIPESSIYCFNKIQFISRSPWQLHTFRVVGADDALLSGPLIVGVRNSGLLPLGVRKVNAGLSKKWGSMFSRMKFNRHDSTSYLPWHMFVSKYIYKGKQMRISFWVDTTESKTKLTRPKFNNIPTVQLHWSTANSTLVNISSIRGP